MLKRLILHPFTFAIFPILALLAHNITEVHPRVALRSIIISLAATLILLLLVFLISRNWKKAGLTTTLTLFLFFSYGQVYEFLQKHPVFGFSLGRHRYLTVIYAVILLIGLWLIFLRLKDLHNVTQALNLIGILLLIYPTYQITSYIVRTSIGEQRMSEVAPEFSSEVLQKADKLPDIYYIILDSYTRSDALLRDFDLDNSQFLQELRDMGFYVVDCSRSNYATTHGSLVVTLNMDYLSTLEEELAAQGLTSMDDVWILIKQSKVRSMLESIGYKTVAFESAFQWSRFNDADVYLKHTGTPYEMQAMQPFEAMLIRSTGLLIWSDATYKSLPDYKHTIVGATNFPFEFYINQQLFILDQLPRLASFPGPKFVFAHLTITHLPFVFDANGEILTDPDYYNNENNAPADGTHYIWGYTKAVQFVDSQMVGILRTLITKSDVPPIIILMGDHGFYEDDRQLNLNALYLPGDGKQALYPHFTSVNSFRVIFDTYFGTDYGLLPDIAYNKEGNQVPEIFPACAQK